MFARAKELGLEQSAQKLLWSTEVVSIPELVNIELGGLQDVDAVKLGLQHVISFIIAKDPDNVSHMEYL